MHTMLKKSERHNPNYLAKVVKLGKPAQHPNAERLLGWIIDGNRVWTDNINYTEGDIVVYFPLECQINSLILSQLNLYSNSDINHDKTQKGFFDKNGRVRAIRLRGEPSEGFILKTNVFLEGTLPLMSEQAEYDYRLKKINESVGEEFDNYDDIWICRKYVPTKTQGKPKSEKSPNKLKDVLIDNQFRFHYDTEQMKKHLDRITPDTIITITNKIHGTSGITANLLIKKKEHPIVKYLKNTWDIENCFLSVYLLLVLLFSIFSKSIAWTIWFLYFPHVVLSIFNKKYYDFMHEKLSGSNRTEYSIFTASRRVIKSVGETFKPDHNGFYNFDIWKHVTDLYKPYINCGITLYYEIVGYLPDGKMIQKGYDYGCKDGSKEVWSGKTPKFNFQIGNGDNEFYSQYEENKNFKVRIYRITYTTPDGKVIEFSWEQIKNYCRHCGLTPVDEIFTGSARAFLPIQVGEDINTWRQAFMNQIQKNYFHDKDPECNNKVPSEGVVIRIENGLPEAYKFKSFAFLEWESKDLDSEENNIEEDEIQTD
jgi:hypothetical protein